MSSQSQLRQQITNLIIAALDEDCVPWRRPWCLSKNTGRPANAASKRPYSGINPLLCEMHAVMHGFQSRWWGTFEQWKSIGGTVRKRPSHVEPGQWGCKIVFYRPVKKAKVDETGEEEIDEFRVMRTWSVFNAEQIDGVDHLQATSDSDAGEFPDFGPAEELIAATGADIRVGGDLAFYRRPFPEGTFPKHDGGDYICLPSREKFETPGAFYENCAHELSHWSEVRLGWDHREHGYAMGELVAEMAACYISQELRIPDGERLDNHARYVGHWLNEMRGDPSYIFKAATQASKVTDYLLSFVKKEEPVEHAVQEAI
jgi:antirestriction protein ArdC